jgi:hypothetical protein
MKLYEKFLYEQKSDNCPSCLLSIKTNIMNHLKTIKEHGLGPIDPLKPNDEFWMAKAEKWGVSVGDARGRMCLNCEHYLQTKQINFCIMNGPIKDFETSMVPTTPRPVDVESRPTAWCMLYDITCSPLRVCDSQEEGGPIDDFKARKLGLDNIDFSDPNLFDKLDDIADMMSELGEEREKEGD